MYNTLTVGRKCYNGRMDVVVIAPGEDHSPALALANSRHNSPAGTVDRIVGPAEATAWLVERGLLPAGTAISAARLDALHELRDAVRAVLVARIKGSAPPERAVEIVNRAAAAAPAAPVLSWPVPDRPASYPRPVGGDALDRALAAVAGDAIDAVCGERAALLLECEAPGCVRLLEKDHSRRRWCSTACGDRVRAARYYARHRRDPAR